MKPQGTPPWALSRRTVILLGVYLIVVGAVFTTIGIYLANHHDDLKNQVIGLFLNEDWVFVGEHLFDRFINTQSVVVLVNAAVSGAVVGVSALTFLLKEKISASYEKDTGCAQGYEHREPPLWEQGFEEIKLVIFYVTMTLLVLRLGVGAEGWQRQAAIIGSYVVLASTMVIDFTSPVLMRHGARYIDIVRLAVRSPIRSVLFGAVFGGLPVAVGRLAVMAELAPTFAFCLIAVVHLLMLMGAILMGTLLGARWLETLVRHKPINRPLHGSAWLVLVLLLSWNLLFFGHIAQAAFHVSPVLKCQWVPISDSFKVEPPTLSNAEFKLALDLRITNPTSRLAQVGENRIELRHRDALLASSKIPEFSVPPGQTAVQKLRLILRPEGGLVRRAVRGIFDATRDGVWDTIKSAADTQSYRLTLFLPTPAGDFPVRIFDDSTLDP